MFLFLAVALAVSAAAGGSDSGQRKLEESRAALSRGDYAKAIEAASQAETAAHEGGDQRTEAAAINQAGLGHLYRAEYGDALEKFERSLELNRRIGNAEAEITAGNNIGNVHFFQGRYAAALDAYETALRKSRETSGQPWSHRRIQLTMVNLGVLYEQLGQNQRALEHYQQANASPTGLTPPEQAQMLSNLGTLYRRMKDPVRALANYREAQNWFDRGQHLDGEIHVLHNIGILMTQDYGDTGRALRAFGDAVVLARKTGNRRQEILGYLFRAEGLLRAGRVQEGGADYTRALDGAREIGGAEEQWSAQFGLGRVLERQGAVEKALSLYREAIRTIESVRSGLRRSTLKSDFLADKRDVYDACIRLVLDAPKRDAAALFTLIEHARARNLQDALGQTPPNAQSVQGRLDGRTLLVEYWAGRDGGAAVWMTNQRMGVVTLPGAGLTASQEVAAMADGKQEWRQWSRSAGAVLLQNLPLANVDTLIVAPDGPLYRVPFEALETEGRLLAERCTVTYLPSASLLLRHRRSRRIAGPWKTQAAAFGDPVLAGAAGRLEGDAGWQSLPYSRDELQGVAQALPGRARVYAGARNLKRHLREEAREGRPVFHFSTHAAADLTDPNRSRILFTPERGRPGSAYLFRPEVEGYDLRGTDLVTVSACDTEGGRLVRGEGVMSFSRAFLAAGARATVTTLWRVPDQPTSEFMRLFYRELGRGASKSAALRAAKLAFLQSGSELAHPRYWAAFVLNGDGSEPLPRVISWSAVLGAGGAVLGGGALLLWVVLRARGSDRARNHADRLDRAV